MENKKAAAPINPKRIGVNNISTPIRHLSFDIHTHKYNAKSIISSATVPKTR